MNKLWLVVGCTVLMLSSCITAAQFNNAEDDVYYSPKASNRKAPVLIPDVDVDEIMKKNPAQYGEPTNRLDDGTTNPYAAIGYPAYKAQQDSLYQKNPRLSGYYVDPSLPNSEQDALARRRTRSYSNSGYWNSGMGYGYGLGYNNYGYGGYGSNYGYGYGSGYGGYGYGGYGNYSSPWGYNSWGYSPGFGMGWSSGLGFGFGYGIGGWGSSFYNPYYYSPYYGYGGYGYGGGYYSPFYNPYYGGYYPYYNNGNGSSDNNSNNGGSGSSGPIERPRPSVGSNNPPANGGGTGISNPNMSRSTTNDLVPSPPVQQRAYTPSAGAARLENINGHQVYTAPSAQPMRPDMNSMAPPQLAPQFHSDFDRQQQNNNSRMFSNPSPGMMQPSSPSMGGGGRSVGGGGGGRSVGGGGGGGQRHR